MTSIFQSTKLLDLYWPFLASKRLWKWKAAILVDITWVTDWEVIGSHEIHDERLASKCWSHFRRAIYCFVWVGYIHFDPRVNSQQKALIRFVRFESISEPTQRSISSQNFSKLIFGQHKGIFKSITTLMKFFSLKFMMTSSKSKNKRWRLMKLFMDELMIEFFHFLSNDGGKHFHFLTWILK